MKVVLLRFGELFLKGGNRKIFENCLISNIKNKLNGLNFKFNVTHGRYIVSEFDDEVEILSRLKTVFGLSSLSLAEEVVADVKSISDYISSIKIGDKRFKVDVKRADKTFPISSMEFAKDLGGLLLRNNENAKVDLYNPEIEINVDIRFNNKAYIYHETVQCLGGLPLGSSGKALLLLSGGIDSPVAGFMMAKRGLAIEGLHFHSYPYTSLQAKEKVLSLAKHISDYTGEMRLHIISFTKVQEEIHKRCAPEFMITIMRRIMMRVAERICEKYNLGAIITGESLGQVASQTMQSLTVTNSVLKEKVVFRPCIGMDKEEIVKISKSIDCFETSILPYEDCCTVFLPKNPVIKPTISRAEREEGYLDIDNLVELALSSEELVVIK